ncbi:MAG: TetR/AcrR family transcriptional regulator [Syntrophaceae bacterium]
MPKQNTLYEKTGGRRISLYAELGRYFTADGGFDETTFRQIIQTSLKDCVRSLTPQESPIAQGKWLSAYLSEVMDYLSEKGMPDAASNLCKTAVEEATNAGIGEVAISPKHLKGLLQTIPPLSAGKKKRQRSLDEKRKKIYQAALKVFSEDGFHQATMNKIATQSGVAKGTVYEYFKSKEELLDQLLEERYEEIVERISAICDRGTNVLEQTREMIEFWVGFIEENPQLYRLIQSEAIFQRSGDKVMFYDYMISHLPMFKERIVALNREKNLKTTSFYTTFYGILGFIDGVAQKWFRCQMDYPLKDEIPVILEVLFNGFVGEQITRRHFFSPTADE